MTKLSLKAFIRMETIKYLEKRLNYPVDNVENERYSKL